MNPGMPSPTRPRPAPVPAWVLGGLILGLVLACYWPALTGALVWDDASHVTRPDLRSWAGLGRIWCSLGATEQYYPVVHSAFWFEYRLWGASTLGYHLVNVFLHAADCCLLVVALVRLGRMRAAALPAGAALLAAVLFAVHPVAVESVAWISEQKNTLSLLFYLLAGLAYLDFRETGRWRTYAGASVLFLLALGTKSVTSSLPAALLVVLWWTTGQVAWRRDGLRLLPWFVAAVAMGLLTAWVERTQIGATGAAFDFSPGQRLLLAARDLQFYLATLAWPDPLLFFYPRWDVPAQATGWIGCLVGAVALTVALFLLRRRARGPLAAWLFFAGTLFPALGFFNVYPFLFSYVADHFQYLACLGIARLGAGFRALGWAAVAAVVAALALRSNLQSREYAGPAELYRAILAGNPDCWKAHELLGDAEFGTDPAAAREEFAAAVRLKPDDGEAEGNLGALLLTVPGAEDEAIGHLRQAIAAAPYLAEPHLNLGKIFERTPGRAAEAAAEYRAALRLNPGLGDAHFGLANVLAQLPGGAAESLEEYGWMLRADPASVPARVNRAGELARMPGREAEALADYEAVLRDHPDLVPVHYNLAIALARMPGREAEAIAQYQETIRLRPDLAAAHRNLGLEYARTGRRDEAAREWRTALALNPGYTDLPAMLQRLDRERGR